MTFAGVELFIFLCIVLFIMALCPFLSVLIHRQVFSIPLRSIVSEIFVFCELQLRRLCRLCSASESVQHGVNLASVYLCFTHQQAAQKWHDVMWYSIEMFVEILSIAASIWVLYHTDYSPVTNFPRFRHSFEASRRW